MLKRLSGLSAAATMLLLAACGGPPAPPPVTQPPPVSTGVAAPAAAANPNAAGAYAANCSGCHGARREGTIGPALTPSRLGAMPDVALKEIIVNGRPNTAMPSFKQLSGAEVDDLVRYIKTSAP